MELECRMVCTGAAEAVICVYAMVHAAVVVDDGLTSSRTSGHVRSSSGTRRRIYDVKLLQTERRSAGTLIGGEMLKKSHSVGRREERREIVRGSIGRLLLCERR